MSVKVTVELLIATLPFKVELLSAANVVSPAPVMFKVVPRALVSGLVNVVLSEVFVFVMVDVPPTVIAAESVFDPSPLFVMDVLFKLTGVLGVKFAIVLAGVDVV